MTDDQLLSHLRPWVRRAHSIIDARFADARSHAEREDIATATERLAELQQSLAHTDEKGQPTGFGIIGDARAKFYAIYCKSEPFDPDVHEPGFAYDPEAAQIARGMPLGSDGRLAHRDVAGLLDSARGDLAGIAAASDPRVRSAGLATWQERHSSAVRSWAAGTLSDSQMTLYHAVNHLRIKKELR